MRGKETRPGLEFSDKIEEFTVGSEVERQAFELAREKHRGVLRQDGSEYFTHCVATASILKAWGLTDESLIAAALMHDLVEDTDVTLTELRQRFGAQIARWVDGVSKLKSRDGKSDENETRRKIVERGYFEPQVVLIKLADRLHNMRTLGSLPAEKQAHKAGETLDVYAPLAESLGVWRTKAELEDLSYPYVNPDRYARVRREVDTDPRLAETVVVNLESFLDELVGSAGFAGRVEVRLKGYYEADKKRERLTKNGRGDGSLKSISDLISYRIILADNQADLNLDAVLACYALMGLIHQHFKEQVDMSRFDDFLAVPAASAYRALQTVVITPHGPVEIAVMTEEQEDFNHWGIISKMRQGSTADLRDYVQKVVFTPAMIIKFLSKNATGWDFAYRVSPLLGARAMGLEVNGENKPMSTVLPNAAVVKVFIGEQLVPNKSDLVYASAKTRLIMEQQIELASAQEAIRRGRVMLEPELANLGILDLDDLRWLKESSDGLNQPLAALLVEFGCTTLEGLYLQIGHQRLSTAEIVKTLVGLGITKEILGWSTIEVGGEDRPGILAELSSLLGSMDKNIIGVDNHNQQGKFDLRLVVARLTDEERQQLITCLQTAGHESIKVV